MPAIRAIVIPDTTIRTLGIVLGFVLGLLVGRASSKAIAKHRATKLTHYLMGEMSQIYFCGYRVWELYVMRFFPRYRKFVDFGFCGPLAALSMMALKRNPTARYVYARAGDDRYEHCWCEFRYRGIWYVIDVCWYYPFAVRRRDYYRENSPEILETCDYDRFWAWLVSQQLHEKMSRPETSWLISEMFYLYNFGESHKLFAPDIDEFNLDDTVGRHINPYLIVVYPEIIFSRRIVHEMMRKPTRERPSAHLVRFTQNRGRKLRRAWAEAHPD